MKIHDRGYKRLLSQPTIIRQIIETFIEEDWVQQLDFSRIERIDKSFISESYREVEADLLFKVPFKDSDRELFFYFLTELQSKVLRFMALRVQHYVSSFYMDFIQSNPSAQTLPAVFPIVLYNGDEKWTAPTQVADLIERFPDLGPYRLSLEFFKIAENEYDRERLLRQSNIATTLFLAEAHYDIHLLYERMVQLFEEEEDREALQVFLNWFAQLALRGYRPAPDYELVEREYKNVEEVKSMLMTAIERDREQLLKTGEARGIQLGEARGIEQGKLIAQRQTLLQLLHFRFAVADEENEKFVAYFKQLQNLHHLTQLVNQLLTAPTLAAFEENVLAYLPKDDEQK